MYLLGRELIGGRSALLAATLFALSPLVWYYSIVALTNCRVARLPMETWVEFLEHHDEVKESFEYEVMRLMSEVMAHTITLHLLDASGRLARFQRKHPELVDRIPKKELAAYLNITPETLSRVKIRKAVD